MKLLGVLVGASAFMTAGGTRVKPVMLPLAVQATVSEQTRNATVVRLTAQQEKGRTVYELETTVEGRGREITIDKVGVIVEIDEEVDLGDIPALAKASLQKRAAGRAIAKVEKSTVGSAVSYEAHIRTSADRIIEVAVNADGTPRKEY
jgi:hypothetical protein